MSEQCGWGPLAQSLKCGGVVLTLGLALWVSLEPGDAPS